MRIYAMTRHILLKAAILAIGLIGTVVPAGRTNWYPVAEALADDQLPQSIANESAPLALETTIPLKGVSGRIDHMAMDLARHHLAVAELGNDSVDVIDLDSGLAVRRITDLGEPQGVTFTAGGDALVVANGDDGSVRFFRTADLALAGHIDLGSDADNVRIDRATGHLVVGYGAGGLAV